MDAALSEITGGSAARLLPGAQPAGAKLPPEPAAEAGVGGAGKGDSISLSPEARRALDERQDGESPHDEAPADEEKDAKPGAPRGADGEPLDEDEIREVERLKKRDREVRTHEQAHQNAGGPHAGAPSYDYEKGPDGRSYATSGEVPIDTAPVSGDPAATIAKMEQVKRAALAPAEPSGADRAIAAKAEQTKMKAERELAEQQAGQAGQPPASAGRGSLVSLSV